VRPVKGQVDDLLAEIRLRVAASQRVLVTTPPSAWPRTSPVPRPRRARALPPLGHRDTGAREDPARSARGRSTSWSGSTLREGWTCPRSRWSPSWTRTRRASCARADR
jgi:hypothetical protein